MKDALPEEQLADALDRVLNKGIVLDAQVRASPAGAQSHAHERVVIASNETYLGHIEKLSYAAPPGLYVVESTSHRPTGFADPAEPAAPEDHPR